MTRFVYASWRLRYWWRRTGLLLYVVHDACIDMEDGLHRTVTPYEERLLAVRVVLCFVLLFLTVSFLA